jgi:hypothetical protein
MQLDHSENRTSRFGNPPVTSATSASLPWYSSPSMATNHCSISFIDTGTPLYSRRSLFCIVQLISSASLSAHKHTSLRVINGGAGQDRAVGQPGEHRHPLRLGRGRHLLHLRRRRRVVLQGGAAGGRKHEVAS